jgi:hypothetical protein
MLYVHGPGAYAIKPGRQETWRAFGVDAAMLPYEGPTNGFGGFLPAMGSAHPDYQYMQLSQVEDRVIGAGQTDAKLHYIGILDSRKNVAGQYGIHGTIVTNPYQTTELLDRSFSWSGAVSVSGKGQLMNLNIQYQTISVTFSYNTNAYVKGAVFQSKASPMMQIVNGYSTTRYDPLEVGRTYDYVPVISSGSVQPLQTLSRFVSKIINANPTWFEVQEVWQLDFTLGSLGFSMPNFIA